MGKVKVRFDREKSRWWELHSQIRRGETTAVLEALRRIARRGVPAADRAEFANLAWRSGDPELGLRALSPIVRGTGRKRGTPTEAEIAEYAACLVRLGAIDEAMTLMQGLPATNPQADLYRGYAHIARWEYREAIPCLTRYLAVPALSDYERLVARINLASSLVYERHHFQAEALLRELLHEASVRGLSLALGVLLELSAGNLILQNKLDSAGPFLTRAEKELQGGGDIFAFLVRKWKAILAFRQRPEDGTRGLTAIRTEAAGLSHWETIRDCDRIAALALKDESLFLRVYFGTPFARFRERLLHDFGKVELPETFAWDLGSPLGGRATELQVREGRMLGSGAAAVRVGHLNHRLVQALSKDFYRPVRVAPLHAAVYPGNHFNPLSSPAVVHAAIARLRLWCRQAALPMEIAESVGAYRLRATAAVRLVVPRPEEGTAIERDDTLAARLREAFPGGGFRVAEAEAILGLSRRSVQRLLVAIEAKGKIRKAGKGRATHYLWTA